MPYESFYHRLQAVLGLETKPPPKPPIEAAFSQSAQHFLLVEAWSNTTRHVLIRGYNKYDVINGSHTTNADKSKSSQAFIVADVPTYLVVQLVETAVRRGEIYVRVTYQLLGFSVQLICSGYIHDGGTLAYPNGANEYMTEGAGIIQVYDMASSSFISGGAAVVPANTRWRIIAVKGVYSSDAVAGNRTFVMSIFSPLGTVADFPALQTQGINLNIQHTWADVANEQTLANTWHQVPIAAEIYLRAAWEMLVTVSNADAGDSWTQFRVMVEEWIEE